jgi:hypothetical protein
VLELSELIWKDVIDVLVVWSCLGSFDCICVLFVFTVAVVFVCVVSRFVVSLLW